MKLSDPRIFVRALSAVTIGDALGLVAAFLPLAAFFIPHTH